MKNLIDAMNWRYAVQKFDTTKKLTDEQLSELLNAMMLAPSSYGLQPWKFIVVTNSEIRAKLREAGYNQPKITEASHLIVLAVKTNIDDALVDEYIELVATTRNMPLESLKGYGDMIKGSIAGRTLEGRIEWAARQAHIALGVLVTSAALEGIDVGPMEGFDPKKFDEILGLEKMNLQTKVIAAVGFRDPADPVAQYKKVRFPREKMVIEVK